MPILLYYYYQHALLLLIILITDNSRIAQLSLFPLLLTYDAHLGWKDTLSQPYIEKKNYNILLGVREKSQNWNLDMKQLRDEKSFKTMAVIRIGFNSFKSKRMNTITSLVDHFKWKLCSCHTSHNVFFKHSIVTFLFWLKGMVLSSFIYSVFLVWIILTTWRQKEL